MRLITRKELLELFLKYSRHDMASNVCKGCNESHHYVLCPYDFLMSLDGGPKLNDEFQRMLMGKAKQ